MPHHKRVWPQPSGDKVFLPPHSRSLPVAGTAPVPCLRRALSNRDGIPILTAQPLEPHPVGAVAKARAIDSQMRYPPKNTSLFRHRRPAQTASDIVPPGNTAMLGSVGNCCFSQPRSAPATSPPEAAGHHISYRDWRPATKPLRRRSDPTDPSAAPRSPVMPAASAVTRELARSRACWASQASCNCRVNGPRDSAAEIPAPPPSSLLATDVEPPPGSMPRYNTMINMVAGAPAPPALAQYHSHIHGFHAPILRLRLMTTSFFLSLPYSTPPSIIRSRCCIHRIEHRKDTDNQGAGSDLRRPGASWGRGVFVFCCGIGVSSADRQFLHWRSLVVCRSPDACTTRRPFRAVSALINRFFGHYGRPPPRHGRSLTSRAPRPAADAFTISHA